MKMWIAVLMVLPFASLQAQTLVNSFDDIQFWVGTGSKRAALVLQWNDGLNPVSLAWGYRWDGEATGIDMLKAIAGSTQIQDPAGGDLGAYSGADSRLTLKLIQYSFGQSLLSVDFLPVSGAQRTRSDWFSGYWEYLIRGGSFEYTNWGDTEPSLYDAPGSPLYAQGVWFSSPIGAGDRNLIDGAWDAYSFAASFASSPVAQPDAVPLPVPTLAFAMVSGLPHVELKTESGFLYQLQVSGHPAGPWTALGEAVPGDGGITSFVEEMPAQADNRPSHRFYRIAVIRQP